jgi:hypothetical protein
MSLILNETTKLYLYPLSISNLVKRFSPRIPGEKKRGTKCKELEARFLKHEARSLILYNEHCGLCEKTLWFSMT